MKFATPASPRFAPAAYYMVYGLAAIGLVYSMIAAYLVRAALPAEPMMWPDSFTYIAPGIDFETSGIWIGGIRQFLYPGFVYLVTNLTGHTSSIATAQHLAGFAGGLVYLAAWWLLVDAMPRPSSSHALMVLLGVAATYLLWMSPVMLLYECYLMPEALFLAGSSCAMFALIWVVRLLQRSETTSRMLGFALALLVVVTVGLYFVVPRWGLGVLIVPVGVGLLILAFRRSIAVVMGGLASGGLVAFVLFVVPEFMLSLLAPAGAEYFPSMAFFGMHADFVRVEIDRELSRPETRFDRVLLQECRDDLDREFLRSREHPSRNPPYPELGFSPEEIIFGDSIVNRIVTHYDGDPTALNVFFRYFYLAAWRHQTGAMLGKISKEMGYCYDTPSQSFSIYRYTLPVRDLVTGSISLFDSPDMQRKLNRSPVWKGYHERLLADRSAATLEHRPWAFRLEGVLADWFLPLAIAAALGGAAVFRETWRGSVTGKLFIRAFIAALPNFAACLTIAVAHSLYPPRYRETNLVFALFGTAAAIVPLVNWCAGSLTQMQRRLRPRT